MALRYASTATCALSCAYGLIWIKPRTETYAKRVSADHRLIQINGHPEPGP